MPAYEHVQSIFAGGEATPRLWGRFEDPFYKTALATCLNWEVLSHGSLRRRPGTTKLRPLDGDRRTRITPMRLSSGQDQLLVLLDRALKLYTIDGVDVASQTPITQLEAVTNGSFMSGQAPWHLLSQARFPASSGMADLVVHYSKDDPRSAPGVYEQLVVSAPCSGRLTFTTSSAVNTQPSAVKQYRVILKLSSREPYVAPAGTPPPEGGETWSALNIGGATAWQGGGDVYTWASSWRSFSPADATPTKWTCPDAISLQPGTYWISFEVQITRYDFPITDQSYADVYLSGVSLQLTAGGASGFQITAPWTADQARDVCIVQEPGRDRALFFHPACAPFYLQFDSVTGSWQAQAVTFNNPPVDPAAAKPYWGPGNYPAIAEIFQGRLWLGGLPSQRSTVFASRSGSPFDFSLYTDYQGSPTANPPAINKTGTSATSVTANCAIVAPLSTKGAIRWLRGRQELLVGTDVGEGIITSQAGVVTPMDFHFQMESAFGSAAMPAVDCGDQALYVSGDFRKVRAMSYSLDERAWLSREVSFTWEHLTAPGIRELHFARDPDMTIVALLNDGTLACCTYDRAQQVAGGYRVTTSGQVVSAAVLQSAEGSILQLAVARPNGFFLERMALSEFAASRVYLDCATSFTIPPSGVLSGLSHLVGLAVQVVTARGVVFSSLSVADDGTLTLPEGQFTPGDPAVVGLPYTSTAVTLPPEGGMPGGPSQRAHRRWVKLGLRLYASGLPAIDGQRAPDRTPSSLQDQEEALFTGDVMMDAASDWDDRGQLTITQDLPLRTEILAVFGRIVLGEV